MTHNCKSFYLAGKVWKCQKHNLPKDSKSLWELYLERLNERNLRGQTGRIRDLDPKEIVRGG